MKHRITVEAYHRMGEAGVLPPDARTELIEGEILDMAPIGSRHASVVNRLVWVIDLENALVHFYHRPGGGSYADISATGRPAVTPIAALPGVAIDLSGTL